MPGVPAAAKLPDIESSRPPVADGNQTLQETDMDIDQGQIARKCVDRQGGAKSAAANADMN